MCAPAGLKYPFFSTLFKHDPPLRRDDSPKPVTVLPNGSHLDSGGFGPAGVAATRRHPRPRAAGHAGAGSAYPSTKVPLWGRGKGIGPRRHWRRRIQANGLRAPCLTTQGSPSHSGKPTPGSKAMSPLRPEPAEGLATASQSSPGSGRFTTVSPAR
jgi:hypothetical protein